MQRSFAVPLLTGVLGACLLVNFGDLHTAAGQGKKGTPKTTPKTTPKASPKASRPAPARPPVNRPAPKAQPRPTPQARPTPRPSTPTPSRPQARPQPRPPAPVPQRPSIGQRPKVPGAGGANRPVSRPVSPRPVNPAARPTPARPQATRPAPLPGGLGGATRPQPKAPITTRPGNNTNVRPAVRPETRPAVPTTRPGVTLPNRPETRPNRPPIGVRPTVPTRPGRPAVTWPSKPDVRPGTRPVAKQPIDPKSPKDKSARPGINWPNRPAPGRPGGGIDRPAVVTRPGVRPSGGRNTVINNNVNRTVVNRTVVNQVNQSSNYYSDRTNVYRPGFPYGYGGSRVADAIYDYNGAWHDNYAYWHRSRHPWYHGAWHGNAFHHDPWGIGTGVVTYGLGLWGLNSLWYTFGYHNYVNPFYVVPPPTVVVPAAFDYSQPVINVVQALPDSGLEPPPLPETASQAFDVAVAEFRRGNYRVALDKAEQALKDFPNDPAMHEFRALCLFAMGQYRQASAAVHALLASGPGWDWTTLSSLYADTDTYVSQLFALEKASAARPDDPALWFLLAYHYTTAGQTEAAKDAIGRAHKLLPDDTLVAQLARAAGVAIAAPEPPPPPPPPPAPADVQLDVTGDWAAARPDGGKIGLSVKPDGTFAWTVVDKGGKKESFDGTFSLEDNVLMLERKAGGVLMGRVTALAENRFHFKAVGGGEEDPGLTFSK